MKSKNYLSIIFTLTLALIISACGPTVTTKLPLLPRRPNQQLRRPHHPPRKCQNRRIRVMEGSSTNLNTELVENSPFLLDIREVSELETDGYIEVAVNISIRELAMNLDKLPGLDEPIVIYCKSGHRGGIAMAALKLLAYTNVRNLAGGINAWAAAELELVK